MRRCHREIRIWNGERQSWWNEAKQLENVTKLHLATNYNSDTNRVAVKLGVEWLSNANHFKQWATNGQLSTCLAFGKWSDRWTIQPVKTIDSQLHMSEFETSTPSLHIASNAFLKKKAYKPLTAALGGFILETMKNILHSSFYKKRISKSTERKR